MAFLRRCSMPTLLSPVVLPILLLIGSNLFMTTAWYGHLKFTTAPLWIEHPRDGSHADG